MTPLTRLKRGFLRLGYSKWQSSEVLERCAYHRGMYLFHVSPCWLHHSGRNLGRNKSEPCLLRCKSIPKTQPSVHSHRRREEALRWPSIREYLINKNFQLLPLLTLMSHGGCLLLRSTSTEWNSQMEAVSLSTLLLKKAVLRSFQNKPI